MRQYLLRHGTRCFITIAILEHAVDFVEEDDARTAATGALEDLANAPLALSDLFAHQLGDMGTNEVQVTQLRTRPQNSRLSGTRRTVQQDARGRRHTEMAVLLGITRSRQMHLGVQTGVDDVVVETLLQRRIPADGGEVPQRGLERRRRYGFLPPPRDRSHVGSESVAAAMVLNGPEETYAAAMVRAAIVITVMNCGIDGDAEIGPREGRPIPSQQATDATNGAQGARRTSASTPRPAPSPRSAQSARTSRRRRRHALADWG